MGLDMYLTKKIYIGAEYEHRKVTGTIDIQIAGQPVAINFSKVSYIEESAAYWRKANHIHQWFVDNVQDGVDEGGGSFYVSREKLLELVGLCKLVKSKAMLKDTPAVIKVIQNEDEIAELLPTQAGFFFGSTTYDQYYLDDIDSTIEQLEPLLDDEDSEFRYSSSW